MIDYLATYRTQDKFKGKHYYVSGALCWFECNQYGDPTGAVYFIRKIPDMKLLEIPRRQRSFKNLLKHIVKYSSLKENLTKENIDMVQLDYEKPRYPQ